MGGSKGRPSRGRGPGPVGVEAAVASGPAGDSSLGRPPGRAGAAG